MSLNLTSPTPTTAPLASLPGCLLDLWPGAAQAYGLMRLRSTYTGYGVRLRRASDDATQDFGFRGNLLDTDAIEAWSANTSAYIVRTYDQSGSGAYLEQTTAGYQPMLVQSSQILRRNGKPFAYFDGSNDRLGGVFTDALKNKAGAHIFSVAQTDEPATSPANARVLFSVPSDTGSARANITDESTTAGQIAAAGRRAAADSATTASAARTSETPLVLAGRYDYAGGVVGMQVNGGAEVTSAMTAGNTTNTTTTYETRLGSSNAASPSAFWLGPWATSVLYESVQPGAADLVAFLKAQYGVA